VNLTASRSQSYRSSWLPNSAQRNRTSDVIRAGWCRPCDTACPWRSTGRRREVTPDPADRLAAGRRVVPVSRCAPAEFANLDLNRRGQAMEKAGSQRASSISRIGSNAFCPPRLTPSSSRRPSRSCDKPMLRVDLRHKTRAVGFPLCKSAKSRIKRYLKTMLSLRQPDRLPYQKSHRY
jgi:hypothetical protein